jgi:hypothetical protein
MKGKPQRHDDDHFIDFSIVLKLSVKSPSLSPPIPSAFTPYPPLSAKQGNFIKSQYEMLDSS